MQVYVFAVSKKVRNMLPLDRKEGQRYKALVISYVKMSRNHDFIKK